MKGKIKYISNFFIYLYIVLIIITIINAQFKKYNDFSIMYNDVLSSLKLKKYKKIIYDTYIALILWPIVSLIVTYIFKLNEDTYDKLRYQAIIGGIRSAFTPLFVMIFKHYMM
jgi:hypothetical protein